MKAISLGVLVLFLGACVFFQPGIEDFDVVGDDSPSFVEAGVEDEEVPDLAEDVSPEIPEDTEDDPFDTEDESEPVFEPPALPSPPPGSAPSNDPSENDEDSEEQIPPQLSVPSSLSASIHEPFIVQAEVDSLSTPSGEVLLRWRWVEGEYDVPSRSLPLILSHTPVSFYDAFGVDEIMASVAVDLPGVESSSLDEPFTLTISFEPALEKDESFVLMGDLFGRSYYVHYDDALVLTATGAERMIEVPGSFDVWSDGVRHTGELASFVPEEHACIRVESAGVIIDGTSRSVLIGQPYEAVIDGSAVEYVVNMSAFDEAEPHLSEVAIRFDYNDTVSVYAFLIDQQRTVVLDDLEFEVSLLGLMCETELISEQALEVHLASQSASLDVGGVLSSGEASLFIEDISRITIPVERTSARLGFAPQRFVLEAGGSVKHAIPSGTSWSSSSIQGTHVTLLEDVDFVTAVVIEYTPSLHGGTSDLIRDVVFGSFEVERFDDAYLLRDTGILKVLDTGSSFEAYATRSGSYTIVSTATESGMASGAETVVTVN